MNSLQNLRWRLRRLYRTATTPLQRLRRRMRYGPVSPGGWGRGWRVLVFRLGWPHGGELHVLAPIDGLTFDWERLRPHVRGEPWPDYAHQPGCRTGVMGWAGHHVYLVTDGFAPQRIPMGELVPGEFHGGIDVGLTLIAVREAVL